MISENRAKLIATILDEQDDADDVDWLTEERIRQALTVGPGFTSAEKRTLWTSPSARDLYLIVKETIRQQTADAWARLGVETELTALAAASETRRTLLDNDSFSIEINKEDEDDLPWSLSLTLKSPIIEGLPPQGNVRLLDGGGLQWLIGRPNRRGEINIGWPHPGISPIERLSSHPPLRIEYA